MNRYQLSVVIPAYNEESRIIPTLTEVVNYLNAAKFNYEVIVSDDGSLDKTAKVVKDFSKNHPQVNLLANKHRGKGYAVYKGVGKANMPLVLLKDADQSTPISEVEKLFDEIAKGADVVVGSREGLKAKRVGEPSYRHVMGRFFNLLVQVLVVPGVEDTQCGFKLLTSTAAKDVFSRMRLYGEDAPELRGAAVTAYDVELLFIARKLGYKIAEVPTYWKYEQESRVNPLKDSWRNFWDVVKVRVNDLRGWYN